MYDFKNLLGAIYRNRTKISLGNNQNRVVPTNAEHASGHGLNKTLSKFCKDRQDHKVFSSFFIRVYMMKPSSRIDFFVLLSKLFRKKKFNQSVSNSNKISLHHPNLYLFSGTFTLKLITFLNLEKVGIELILLSLSISLSFLDLSSKAIHFIEQNLNRLDTVTNLMRILNVNSPITCILLGP